MHLSLTDRTVLVTGGGSGIGKGVAATLVAAGARVMIVGRHADKLAAAVDEITANPGGQGGSIRYEPADVTHEDEVSLVVDAAAGRESANARRFASPLCGHTRAPRSGAGPRCCACVVGDVFRLAVTSPRLA